MMLIDLMIGIGMLMVGVVVVVVMVVTVVVVVVVVVAFFLEMVTLSFLPSTKLQIGEVEKKIMIETISALITSLFGKFIVPSLTRASSSCYGLEGINQSPRKI